MALTALQYINKVLKRAHVIDADLTSFTDSSRQLAIDTSIQATNHIIGELLSTGDHPSEITEGTVTLVSGTREYSLASDFAEFASDDPRTGPVVINVTDQRRVYPYPGGYFRMRQDQPDEDQYTGDPIYWVLNPQNNKLRFDRDPTSTNAGDVYRYLYKKRIDISATTDTFTVNDEALDDAIPAVIEYFKRMQRGPKEYDGGLYRQSMGLAVRKVREEPQRRHYGPRDDH